MLTTSRLKDKVMQRKKTSVMAHGCIQFESSSFTIAVRIRRIDERQIKTLKKLCRVTNGKLVSNKHKFRK